MSRFSATLRSRRAWVLLLVAGVAGVSAGRALADLTPPQPQDRTITKAVTRKLQFDHLSHHRLDDEMSERWLKSYLKTLDPLKLYFTQADVDEFDQHKDDLDDWALAGDVKYGHFIFQRFLTRIEQRVKLTDELLKEKPDYTVDETFVIEPDAAVYARTDADVRDLWRRRVKYDLLNLMAEKARDEADAEKEKEQKSDEKSTDKADDQTKANADGPTLSVDEPADKPAVKRSSDKSAWANLSPEEKLSKRYRSFLRRWKQTDNSELLELYLTALATSYDPHTSYMSPDTLNDFEIQMRLNLEGIGAALKETQEGTTVIQKIIPGGAADKDGRLKRDDKVLGVGQDENGAIVDVTDMKLRDVVKLIRGHGGTVVRLKVLPSGADEPKTYNIVRAQVELTDSEARSQIIEVDRKGNGTPFKIGFIDLPSFYMDMEAFRAGDDNFKSCTRDVQRLIAEFNKQKVDAVVVDLRRNGGGSLTESISLTGLFINTGPVVQVKDSDKRVQHYDDPDHDMLWKGPLVVLTSKFSASASEIFAGAIQDYHRGLIVGDVSTHGKGTVQSLADIGHDLTHVHPPKLGALKVTIQQFYRPNGDSTQNRGVLADVELPSIISQLDIGESSYDYALKFDHVPQLPYTPFSLVQSDMVQGLKAKSTKRCADSKDFMKVARKIDRYNQQKNRKSISLIEKTFLAERAEINADREEEKEIEEINDPNRPVFDKDNFYSQEVMAVTVDYLRALQGVPGVDTVGQSNRPAVGAR